MKKSIAFIILAGAAAFTGCFDVVHYIEPRNDKTVFIDYRVTSVMGKGKKEFTFDRDGTLKDLQLGSLKTKLSIKDCSGDLESGYEISGVIPESMLTFPVENVKAPLLPYKDRLGQYVLLFQDGKRGKDQSDKMAEAILMTAKYRIVIGGAKPKAARLISNDDKKIRLTVYTLGTQSYIDIPLGLVFGNEGAVIISFTDSVSDAEMTAHFAKARERRAKDEEKARLEREHQNRIEQEKAAREEKLRLEKEKQEADQTEKPGFGEEPGADIETPQE